MSARKPRVAAWRAGRGSPSAAISGCARPCFYPALTAARCCPAAAAFVDRLVAHGKTRLQAIVALMGKLLHGLHAMWRNDEDFDAEKLFAPA